VIMRRLRRGHDGIWVDPQARCVAPERSDREQEVGGLWRVGRIGGELRGAFGCEEAGVAVLPTLELAVEEGAARRVIA
jgi:hypothetical protein